MADASTSAAACRISSATRTTCDHLRAPRARGRCARRRGRRPSPPRPCPSRARAAGRSPSAARRNDLRDGPTSTAGPSARKRRAAAPAHHSCAPARLANPSPGSTIEPLARRRRATARSMRSAQLADDLARPRRRSRASSYMSLRAARACASGPARHAARGDDARQRRVVPQAADVVDDRRARVEGGRARPRPCRCRPRSGRAAAAPAPQTTGSDARAAPRPRRPASAPGRVDSPPTSMRSAPAASIAQRRVDGRARDRARWPPSAKESGVTLRMPITSVRSPSDERPPGSGTCRATAGIRR